MKILKLKLRGAIGIRKGLGVEEVEIDFSQYQPGLIALTGRNGSGKTTIMENLHPYRMMVSRDGSLQSHFFLKDSYRILEFEQNGVQYRSKILIDALTGASEAYLFNETNKTVLNDGKLTTYDEAIENLLGSPDLFFNSVFSGQKSKGIAELKPADRRKLFYELLNLNIYEKYLEQAKANLKTQELKLAEIEGEISALKDDEGYAEQMEAERVDLLNEKAAVVSKIHDLEDNIERFNQEIKDTEVKLKLTEQTMRNNMEYQNRLDALGKEAQEAADHHNAKIKMYNSDIEDASKLISRNKKLLENKETIEKNLKEIDGLEKELMLVQESRSVLTEEYSEFQKSHKNEFDEIAKREKKLSELKLIVQQLQNNFNENKNELSRIENNVKIIDEVPCTEEVGFSCKFLTNAHRDKKGIENLRKELLKLSSELIDQKKQFELEKQDLKESKEKLTENYNSRDTNYTLRLKSISAQITDVEKKLKELKSNDWKKMLEEAKEAENNIRLLEQKIENTNLAIGELVYNFNKNISRLQNESAELNKKIDTSIGSSFSDLKATLDRCQQLIQMDKQELNGQRSQLENLNGQIARVEEQIESLKKDKLRIAELEKELNSIENEIRDWTFLVKAFDKTGIPVLKLENSGIEITSIANELLSIFENKFRIVFETTKLKADKKSYKESFDINIVEEDGVCEISNKSGGQQVWLETAIQLAISLVVRNQGRNIQTAFLDEKDGALDLDNAFHYIEMLRRAHELSSVHNTFIITHRPELLDFIPQQIKLRDGVLEVMN